METIDATEVKFKSVPEMYEKEESGIKPNTTRLEDNLLDERFKKLKSGKANVIRIVNTKTGKSFSRVISDISSMIFDGARFWIISWKDERDVKEGALAELNDLLKYHSSSYGMLIARIKARLKEQGVEID